jgi:MFS family permease
MAQGFEATTAPAAPASSLRLGLGSFTAAERRVLVLLSVAALLGQYTRSIFGFALPQIQAGLGVGEGELGLLASLLRLGALPALAIGVVADRVGRRSALLAVIFGELAVTGLTALAPGVASFGALQLAAQLFATAQVLLAVVVLSEELAPERRGHGIGVLFTVQALGAGVAAVMLPLVDDLPGGWRGLYALAATPILPLLFLARSLPETHAFEAHRARSRTAGAAPLASLLRGSRGRLAAVCAVTLATALGGGAADLYSSKYLQQMHAWPLERITAMILVVGPLGLLGSLGLGALGDRVGRRPVTLLAGACLPVFALGFYNASGGWLPVLFAGTIFMQLGHEVLLAAYAAELFPTSQRATAGSVRAAVAAVGGVLGLAAESALYTATGSHWTAVSWLLAVVLVAPVVVALTFPETARRPLEDLAPEHPKEASR